MKQLLMSTAVVAGMTLLPLSRTMNAQGTGSKPPVKQPIKAPLPGAPDLSTLPKSHTVPTTFEGLFAERDQRSVGAIGYFRCMQGTLNAIRNGNLGNVPREWTITCIEHGGEWRGVFGELTDRNMDVKLQVAFRGDRAAIISAPVDTARVSGTARALLRGLAAPHPGAGRYEFIPVPLAQDNFVEVWFLPVPSNPSRAVVGGDSLIQMTADGMRELGHGRTSAAIRPIVIPLEGSTWTLASVEERIPLVSELMIARMALDLVPEVRIRTNQYESVLTRSAKDWVHRRR